MTSSITVKLDELRDLLARAIPFADASKYGLPILNAVHLTARKDHLVTAATNRYVLGMARLPFEGGDGFAALIKLQDVKHILNTFKNRKDVSSTVTLTVDGETASGHHLTISLADGFFATADDLTAKYRLLDGDFPKLEGILKPDNAGEFGPVGVNPALLARFANVGRSAGEPMRVVPHASKAIVIQVGDHFIGAIMPVKLTDSEYHQDRVDEWVEMFRPQKPARRSRAKKSAA